MENYVFAKLAMNTQNRVARRCVIGKVTPKTRYVMYLPEYFSSAEAARLRRESMFKAENEWVSQEMARNREMAAQAVLLPDTDERPPIWFFIVALLAFLAIIAAVWSAS